MTGNRTIVVLSAAAALLMIGVGLIVALLPQRVHAATGSLESVGLIASVFAVTYLLAQLPAGFLADRFGARSLLLTGYVLCGAAGLLFFATDTAASILVGRAIQGLGEAPIWALGPALLSVAYPYARGRVIGIYNAAIHLGLTIGPVAGLMLGPAGGGQMPFLLFSLLCFLGAVLLRLFLPGRVGVLAAAAISRPSWRTALGLFAHRRSLVVLTGIALYGACYGVFVSVLPITAVTLKEFGPRDISILFIVFYASIGVSQLVAGPLSDRWGRQGFMIGGLVLAVAGLSSFLSLAGLWVFAALALASAGLGVFCVASLAQLNDGAPRKLKGTVSGGYYFAWALGYMFGPLVIGWSEPVSPGLGYCVLSVAMAIQVVMLCAVRR